MLKAEGEKYFFFVGGWGERVILTQRTVLPQYMLRIGDSHAICEQSLRSHIAFIKALDKLFV